MFIREKKLANNTKSLVQIVENQRIGSKTKQHVLRHVGTGHTPEQIIQLKRLAAIIKSELENQVISQRSSIRKLQFAREIGQLKAITQKVMVDITKLQETKRCILGIHDVYGSIYDQLGFINLFTRPHQREDAAKILREIVLARIANPLSKRSTVELLNEKFGVSINLDHVYQMMDKIDDHFCERIQQRALAATLKLTGEKLRILFYDATALYFESFKEDELKKNGYSKDMKFNQPQILLTLFVTEKGLPIGYEVFPGNTFEGHTLVTVLEKLKERYDLSEVIFVADRGLFSEENLKLLEEKKFKYIVGARIKNVSKKMKKEILNPDNYQNIEIEFNNSKKNNKPLNQRIAAFEYGEKSRLLVHYSEERAKKDEGDRIRSLEKLQQKLMKSKDPKSLLSNYGYKKFLKINGHARIDVHTEKIAEVACWDGLAGIITNDLESSPTTLFAHYRGLWQIEESFRINKHDLRMRPIYHWKPQRVKAHIAISFMAFVCVRYLEYIILARSKKISPEKIRQTLLEVQASAVEDTQSHRAFLLFATISAQAKKIYQLLGIKLPSCTTEIHCGA